ncbi:MAG: hypothetical protein ACW98D_09460, partial [Promethearchaeota archaeon]
MIVVGVIIVITAFISRRIIILIKEENRNRVLKGSVVLLIGVIVLISFTAFRINKPEPFMEYYILYIDACIIGIALILAGTFTIIPIQSKNGKIILGIITIVFGVIIIIIPLFHISIWWNSGIGARGGALAMASPLFLIGILFLI